MSDTPQIRVITIPTDPAEPVAATRIPATDLGIYQALGGGEPEAVFLPDLPGALYVHAGGKTAGLDPNPRATRLVQAHIPGFSSVDMIMGPVLCLGLGEDTETDVPPALEAAAIAEQQHRSLAPAWQTDTD